MSAAAESLELLAAVSGPFEPLSLAPSLDPTALGPLSLKCDEVIDGGTLRWILKGDYRRTALAQLGSLAQARSLINQAPKPARDDLFTTTLRAALLGSQKSGWARSDQTGLAREVSRLGQDQERDFAIQSALQFAGHAGYLAQDELKAPIAATRGRLSQRRGQLALRATLPKQLIGRRQDLSRLVEFAQRRGKGDPQPLYLTGLGGVGKSALVAALLLELQKARALAIQVDFDAVGLSTGEPAPVFLEIVQQFALMVRSSGHEQQAEALGKAREDIQAKTRERGTGAKGIGVDEQFSSILSQGLPALHKVPAQLRRKPLLLVFDSFEVVPPRQLPSLMRLVGLLRDPKALPGLRLLVSGRELPPVLPDAKGNQAAPDPRHHIQLRGLPDEDGARFLAAYDSARKFTRVSLRQRATRALKGHPLALLVLERFARSQPLDAIEDVLDELERDPAFSAEFAQSFLYTRVLDRISEPAIKRLAHPGLILREITPGLIRLVLAEPCDLGEIGDPEAAALLEQLGEHYWLVQPLGPDHLRHRADIRRMMVPTMLAGPRPTDSAEVAKRKTELRDQSLRAAANAARFWRNGPPKGDSAWPLFEERSPDDRWVEATYYGALAGEPAPPQLSAEQAGRLERGIGSDDLATLKPSWRGEIKVAQRNFDGLTRDEIEALGVDSRALFETSSIDRTLKAGEAQRAAAMAEAEQHRAREHRQLEEAQMHLRDAGYYKVRIDGILGPAMRQALAELGITVAAEAARKPDWTTRLLRQVKRRVEKKGSKIETGAEPEGSPLDEFSLSPETTPDPIRPRGDQLTVELAESRALADFQTGDCDPKVAELLIDHLLEDRLPPSVRSEIEKGRLWNTGLWQAALTAAARRLVPANRFDWSRAANNNPMVETANVLISGLFGSGSNKRAMDPERLTGIILRSDGRLEGHDGLRLMLRLVRLKSHPKFRKPTVYFDGSNLTLLASDGLIDFAAFRRKDSAWLADSPNSSYFNHPPALIAEKSRLDQFQGLFKQAVPMLADLESAWSGSFFLRADLQQLPGNYRDELRTLRIQSPELVLPATRILSQMEPNLAAAAVNRVARQSRCWPRELWFEGAGLPDQLIKFARQFNPELSFAVAQTSDRYGLLDQLLAELRASKEAPPKTVDRLHLIYSHLMHNFAPSSLEQR